MGLRNEIKEALEPRPLEEARGTWGGVTARLSLNSLMIVGAPDYEIPTEVVGWDERKNELTVKVAPRYPSGSRAEIHALLTAVRDGTVQRPGPRRIGRDPR